MAIFGQCLAPLVELEFEVGTENRVVVVPREMITLDAAEHFQTNTLIGSKNNTSSENRVVDTNRALLVGTEDESRSELLVEGACRGFDPLVVRGSDLEIGKTCAVERFRVGHVLVAGQGLFHCLETYTGGHIFRVEVQVDVGISEECASIIILVGTDGFIILSDEPIRLHRTAEFHLSVLCKEGRSEAQQQGC